LDPICLCSLNKKQEWVSEKIAVVAATNYTLVLLIPCGAQCICSLLFFIDSFCLSALSPTIVLQNFQYNF